MAFNNHFAFLELAAHILGRLAWDVDPNAGEDSTAAHHEEWVQQEVDRIPLDVRKVTGWWNVVGEAANGCGITSHVEFLPLADELNEEIASELAVQDLTEEVQVGDDSCLQNDWDVGSVEELDGERSRVAASSLALESQVHLEALEVNYDENHDDRRK